MPNPIEKKALITEDKENNTSEIWNRITDVIPEPSSTIIFCSECKEQIPINLMNNHINECHPLHALSCPFCNWWFMTRQDILKHQETDCSQYPMVCPNHCSQITIVKSKLEAHLKEVCPLEKINCPCGWSDIRNKYNDHMKSKHPTGEIIVPPVKSSYIDFSKKLWDIVGWNRWVVIVGAIVIQLALGVIYSWGTISIFVSFPGFTDTTKGDIIYVFAISLFMLAFTMFFAGQVQNKYGPQVVTLFSAISLAVVVCLTGFANSFWGMLICYGFFYGGAVGIGYVCPIACAAKWFPDKKGLINGLAVAGFGAGSFVFNFLIKALANPNGVKTSGDRTQWTAQEQTIFKHEMNANLPIMFLVLGIVEGVMVAIGSLTMRNPPSDYKVPGWTPPKPKDVLLKSEYTRGEAMRTWSFWLLWFRWFLSAISGLMVIGNYGAFGSVEIQVEDSFIALLGGIAALVNAIGRVAWGFLCDKIGYRYTMLIMFTLQSIIMGTYYLTKYNQYVYFLSTCLLYFCFGGNFSLFPTATCDMFGTKNLGANYGAIFSAYGIAAISGALLVSFTKSSFLIVFLSMCGMSVLGIIITIINPLPGKKLFEKVEKSESSTINIRVDENITKEIKKEHISYKALVGGPVAIPSENKDFFCCQLCEEMVKAEEIENHLVSSCKKFPVECPNGCKDDNIFRDNVGIHIKKECSFRDVTCDHHIEGCKWKGIAKDLPVHMSASVDYHLKLVEYYLKQVRKQNIEMQSMLDRYINKQDDQFISIKIKIPDWKTKLLKYSGDQYWKSQVFSVPTNKGLVSFVLRCYPNDSETSHTSFYLECIKAPVFPFTLTYKLQVDFGKADPWIRSIDNLVFSHANDDWGWGNCLNNNIITSDVVTFTLSCHFSFMDSEI